MSLNVHVPLIQSDDTWKFRELPRKFTSLAVTPGIDSKDMSLCFYVRDFYDERFVYPSWHHAVRVPMPAVSSDSALNYPDNCQSIVDSNTNWIKYRKCKYWIIRPKHPKSNTSRIPGIDCYRGKDFRTNPSHRLAEGHFDSSLTNIAD